MRSTYGYVFSVAFRLNILYYCALTALKCKQCYKVSRKMKSNFTPPLLRNENDFLISRFLPCKVGFPQF